MRSFFFKEWFDLYKEKLYYKESEFKVKVFKERQVKIKQKLFLYKFRKVVKEERILNKKITHDYHMRVLKEYYLEWKLYLRTVKVVEKREKALLQLTINSFKQLKGIKIA